VSLEGPLAAYLTDVLITNCTTAKDGGGLFIQNPTQAVVITRVLFRGNTAGYKAPNTPDGSADPGYGGAINAWNVPTLLLLVNATLENNRAHGCGGMVAGRSRMVFNPFVRVTNNTAAERGGGVCVGTGSTLRLAPSKPSVAGLLEQGDAAAATAPEEEKQQLLRMVSGNNAPDGQDFWWTQVGQPMTISGVCLA
jgi:predicted outer membrane repeat protein